MVRLDELYDKSVIAKALRVGRDSLIRYVQQIVY
jgi:hypothetical protein